MFAFASICLCPRLLGMNIIPYLSALGLEVKVDSKCEIEEEFADPKNPRYQIDHESDYATIRTPRSVAYLQRTVRALEKSGDSIAYLVRIAGEELLVRQLTWVMVGSGARVVFTQTDVDLIYTSSFDVSIKSWDCFARHDDLPRRPKKAIFCDKEAEFHGASLIIGTGPRFLDDSKDHECFFAIKCKSGLWGRSKSQRALEYANECLTGLGATRLTEIVLSAEDSKNILHLFGQQA